MIRHLIFDMDGTLLDTLPDLTDSVNRVLALHGLPERSIGEVRAFVGNGLDKLMRRALPADADEALFETCARENRSWYREHAAIKTRPYDGLPALLDALKARGIACAVVTNKDEAAANALVDRWFPGRFDAVIGDDGATPAKPDPAGVYRAMKALGASGDDTLFAGDSDVDVRTALNAGLPCVGVTWGFRDRAVLEEAGASFIADTPEEVLALAEKRA